MTVEGRRHDCPASLADLLERRIRLAYFAPGQGERVLPRIAATVGDALGWDEARRAEEASGYRDELRRRFRVAEGMEN